MDRFKKAGIRFNEELFINFEYDPETNTINCYRNGELINGGVTPEELYIILSDYCTKEELQAVEAEIPDVTNLATKTELQAVEAEIPDVTNLATKTELQAVEAEIPDVTNLVTKTEFQAVEAKVSKIKFGYNSTSVPANSYADIPITFTEAYAGSYNPTVIVGLLSSLTNADQATNLQVSYFGASNTGFTLRMFNNTSATRNVYATWFAM